MFPWDGKTASNGRVIWSIWTIGVHYPENHFLLARMKDLLKNESILDVEKALSTRSICEVEKMVSTRQKIGFHQTGWRIRFKNTFITDRKIKLTVEGMFENGRKKCLH